MTSSPADPAPARVPELDGLRGIAILLVLLWHWVAVPIDPAAKGPLGALRAALLTCWSGVDLFFVLSGFLIGGILLDQRGSPGYFSTFYLRRACRIFPLYFLGLGLFALALGPLALAPRFPWLFAGELPLWPYACWLQNYWMATAGRFGPNAFGVTWSLAIEEQFYLLLPLAVWLLPRRPLIALLATLTLLVPAVRWYAQRELGDLAPYVLLPCRWDALFLGVLLACLMRTPAASTFVRERPRLLPAAALVLGAGVALLTWLAPEFHHPFTQVFGYSLLAAFFGALLALVVVAPGGRLGALTRAGWLRRLGVISYGVYLLHMPVNGLCHQLLRGHTYALPQAPGLRSLDDLLVTLLAAAVTIGVALASHRWFESPLIRLGHRRRYTPSTPRGGTSPADNR